MLVSRLGSTVLAASAVLSAGVAPRNHAPATWPPHARESRLPAIAINDNLRPAGIPNGGTLMLSLRAAAGLWRPEGEKGPALEIEAFGEDGSSLTIPAPLIRVPEGTEVAATVRNELTRPLRVFGMCERGGEACAPLEVPPGQARLVTFLAGRPGTYHYWATTTGMPLPFRAVGDTQLSGAFIVDPAGIDPARDRIFVITDWTSLTLDELTRIAGATDPGAAFLAINPKFTFLMNGLSWPHTERLTYQLSEKVRWRVINLSTQVHTMHLHGFYFDVASAGDGLRDEHYSAGRQPHVVTQLVQPGGTMSMSWMPERTGNWLFHCHIRDHVAPELRLDAPADSHGAHHKADDASAGMAGMILGVTVVGVQDDSLAQVLAESMPPRKLTLEMQAEPERFGAEPAYGFVMKGSPAAAGSGVPIPGPTLVLKRDEPVEITLVNRLPEATAIHWHGMELDSYYDGVHGFSGAGLRVTPLIEPGGSFVVRFTPPGTGTFMYHTHLHDKRQLTSGLYGAMLVLEENETFDESTDHVIIMGRDGADPEAPAVLNGQRLLQTSWKAGARHRVRLINITPNDIFSIALQTNEEPVMWRPLTKDGAPVPSDRRAARAARQLVGAGETYDFEYQAPPGRQNVWLEVRSRGGKWQTQGHIIVR